MFYTQSDNCILFFHIFDIIFLFSAEFEEEPKIGISSKGLNFKRVYTFNRSNIVLSFGEKRKQGIVKTTLPILRVIFLKNCT